ncbi:hypothetical protein D9619_007301 [Psilocybe cf. subviscida]|uniref:Uncharacterized protein n=1 Tax=Psilocybe cf. subviscida TaxID=2480587 RepID=A0A8H5B288_9AGAR|nr:hypothetical protein D9619_007301 [Psilocybe cf. subviscida]
MNGGLFCHRKAFRFHGRLADGIHPSPTNAATKPPPSNVSCGVGRATRYLAVAANRLKPNNRWMR